jgi:hypothetical protein
MKLHIRHPWASRLPNAAARADGWRAAPLSAPMPDCPKTQRTNPEPCYIRRIKTSPGLLELKDKT